MKTTEGKVKPSYKLPRFVFRTKFGVFRFKRNIPEHLQATLNQKTFYRVLGKDYGEAMRG